MPLLQMLEVLIVVGVLLWLVDRFIPMQRSIKSILNGVVVIARRSMASERVRTLSLALRNACWHMSAGQDLVARKAEAQNPKIDIRNTAAHLQKETF